jgi:carbonic anhydrase
MHFSPTTRFAGVRTLGFAWVAGMALVTAACAAGGHHEDAHDEDDAHGHVAPSAKAAPRALASKPSAKTSAERKGAESTKEAEGASAKGVPAAAPGVAPEGRMAVSMAELRDMIDQKIAEVRTQRQAPPVLLLRPKTKPAPKKPAATLHASVGPTHDARGALLPLAAGPGDMHEHDAHGAAPAIALAPMGSRAINPLGRDVHWAYSGDTGPEQWGRLKPEFQQCMLGKRQSPIDIRDGIPVQNDPIQFDYRPSGFRVIDNGHTVQINVEQGNGIIVQGRRYELVQFHFHRPSEERINGKQFDMVAHLVHKDPDGRLAVVAVLMDSGKGHPLVQQVWNNLPLEKQVEQAGLTPMDLTQLLPDQRQYYTYMGSLTTPPCTEGVLWMVMKHPATISREQIGVFSKLYQMNARPIQSGAGRLIKDGQ